MLENWLGQFSPPWGRPQTRNISQEWGQPSSELRGSVLLGTDLMFVDFLATKIGTWKSWNDKGWGWMGSGEQRTDKNRLKLKSSWPLKRCQQQRGLIHGSFRTHRAHWDAQQHWWCRAVHQPKKSLLEGGGRARTAVWDFTKMESKIWRFPERYP